MKGTTTLKRIAKDKETIFVITRHTYVKKRNSLLIILMITDGKVEVVVQPADANNA